MWSGSGASRRSCPSVPDKFKGALRPYQQHGVDWLQHLASHGLGGFLADDMGLGKTAQTIAHIVRGTCTGRLTAPGADRGADQPGRELDCRAWKFRPASDRVVVLHGMERHEKREQLDDVNVVVTTYTVLTRDIEEMKRLALASGGVGRGAGDQKPAAQATRAVAAEGAPPALPVRHADRE